MLRLVYRGAFRENLMEGSMHSRGSPDVVVAAVRRSWHAEVDSVSVAAGPVRWVRGGRAQRNGEGRHCMGQ
jgi:hypothetical protein